MANERKAQVTYTGNGTQTQYSFPFDYLRKAFVKVKVIGGDSSTVLTQGTDYTVSDRTITFTTAPSGLFMIYRETTTGRIVEWADASVLTANDMTLQEVQLLHIAEETMDRVSDSGLALDATDGNWDARFAKIKNVYDPTDPNDVVTLNYITKNKEALLNVLKAEGDAQDERLVTEGNTQVKRVTDTGDAQNTRVINQGDTQYKRLQAQGDAYVKTMTDLKTAAETFKNDAKSSADRAEELAQNIGNPVKSVTEEQGKVTVTQLDGTQSQFNAGLNILARNKAYAVGDIAYSPNLPSYMYLECVQAGTTGATEPDFSKVTTGGVVVTDGTIQWKAVSKTYDRKYFYNQAEKHESDISTLKNTTTTQGADIGDLMSLVKGTFTKELLAGSETLATRIIGGNITLSKPWTDFDGLLIFLTNDGTTVLSVDFISVPILKMQVDKAKLLGLNLGFAGGSGGIFWELNALKMTDKLLPVSNQNSDIQAIYGITLKGDNT